MRSVLFSAVFALSGATVAGAHVSTIEATDVAVSLPSARVAVESGFDLTPFAFRYPSDSDLATAGWSGDDSVTDLLLHGLAVASPVFSVPVTFSGAVPAVQDTLPATANRAKVSPVPLPGSLSMLLSLMSVYVLVRTLGFLLALRSEQQSRQFEQAATTARLAGHFRV